MNNFRIVHDNVISRAVLSASSAEQGFPVSNLQSDRKSSVWRGAGKTERLTATWPGAETIRAVALPFCNLSRNAQMRVRTTLESPRVNYFKYSEQLDVAATWVPSNLSSQGVNVMTAPDGNQTANRIIDAAASGANTGHFLTQTVTNAVTAAGQTFCVSVFVKAGEVPFFCLRFDTSTTATGGVISNVYVNLATGAKSGESGTNVYSYVVTPFPDGWYRVRATAVSTAAGSVAPRFMLSMTGTNYNYVGDGLKGMYMWGAMLEMGNMSSYYPTAGAIATRQRGFIDPWQSYAYDSGFRSCSPAPAQSLRGFTNILASSAYAYGGGTVATHWMPEARQAYGLAVDIVDPENLNGGIEAACLVAGDYWSPQYNASGTQLALVDTTACYRTDAGDQVAEAGTQYRKLTIDQSAMTAADRATYAAIMRNSRAYPVLLSVFPESDDPALERDYTVYGRRTKNAEFALAYAAAYSTTDEIEEI